MRGKTMLAVVAVCVAVVALAGGPAEAGLDEWTSDGPFGGPVRALAIDPITPATLYAGTSGAGVYKSLDGGGHWSASSVGLPAEARIEALAIDPQTPTTLYATIGQEGVYKSVDGGASWSAANEGMDQISMFPGPPSFNVGALAIDPQIPSTLYVGRGSGLGVFKSSDGGGAWSATGDGLPELANVSSLAIDPQTPGTLYAGTFESGVYKSTDGGAQWDAANAGLADQVILALAIDPLAPATLYVGTNAGVFKSIDGGSTWLAVNEGSIATTFFALAIDPQTAGTLYSGGVEGAFRSVDGGASWSAVNEGLVGRLIFALAIDPLTPSTLYAGTRDGGVFQSADSGASWSATNDGLNGRSISALAIDPQKPSTLYAGTGNGGMYKSTSGGTRWTAVNEGPLSGTIFAVAIDPQTPSTVYAGTSRGVFRSFDGGASWSIVDVVSPSIPAYALAIDPETPEILYVGTDDGVFKSIDGGGQWSASSNGVPAFRRSVQALVLDPQNTDVLYAGMGGGVYKSTNGGAQWSLSSDGLTEFPDQALVTALAIDPQDPSRIFTAVVDPGVLDASVGVLFRSENGGDHWSQVDDFPVGPLVGALAIDPLFPATLYAGLESSNGVYKSTDGGQQWSEFGLQRSSILALAIDPATPSTLYAGTANQSVFGIQQVSDRTVMPLQGGRFTVEVDWRDFQGATGAGKVAVVAEETAGAAVLRSSDSAVTWFFSPDNWELLVKVLDGRAFNDHFWVFLSAATDVEVTTIVTDTSCGTSRTYVNPLGQAAPAVTDATAFRDCADPSPPSCVDAGTTLCLGEDGRFRVETTWRDFAGVTGVSSEVSIPTTGLAKSDDSGLFYFFSEDNWEVLVKVLDGCGINDRFWVFAAATTDVEYTLTVTDTDTDEVKTYTNPLGRAADAVADTEAFATCP